VILGQATQAVSQRKQERFVGVLRVVQQQGEPEGGVAQLAAVEALICEDALERLAVDVMSDDEVEVGIGQVGP
jgi:hypothetical protein